MCSIFVLYKYLGLKAPYMYLCCNSAKYPCRGESPCFVGSVVGVSEGWRGCRGSPIVAEMVDETHGERL